MLHISAEGKLLQAWPMPTRYLHDTILEMSAQGAILHTADTGSGLVFQHRLIAQPTGLALDQVGSIRAAEGPREHINSVAGGMYKLGLKHWVMRAHMEPHPSQIVEIVHAKASSETLQRVWQLDTPACHALVWWRNALLFLNSTVGGLTMMQWPASANERGTSSPNPDPTFRTLWFAGPAYFAKGLAVVDDVAYIGLSLKSSASVLIGGNKSRQRARARMNRNDVSSEIVAIDLVHEQLQWRLPLPRPGLVNSISAPTMHPESSFRAISPSMGGAMVC